MVQYKHGTNKNYGYVWDVSFTYNGTRFSMSFVCVYLLIAHVFHSASRLCLHIHRTRLEFSEPCMYVVISYSCIATRTNIKNKHHPVANLFVPFISHFIFIHCDKSINS